MAKTDISVIMCVRNGERLIAEALDSVEAQQVERLETLVVDDGSTDGTAEVARAHRLRPRLICQQSSGVSEGRNRAVEHASGELICFLDHDDVWPDGRLAAMRDALRADPTLDGVFGNAVNTDVSLKPIASPLPSRLATGMLARRSAFLKVGPFRTDVAHASGVDWISRAEAFGLRFGRLDRVVVLRRIHGDNMGIVDRSRCRADMLRVIRDHHKRARGH
jgi:glycosyltransferase involved in cell wall biosynthesis